ncbi:MAG TPA: hypothetical protein VMU53_14780 [Candidatus Sulfotelmatobacter sp.]|nr:hypothetical protein [Candidatus Sulfotelmatobacter sp.]
MADWKQITARIRRARTSKDPAGQLTNLFSKTRDAMVAFELARYFETSGNNADAGRWYLTAAERFRRADWKTKAQESATRLGATEPAEIPEPVRTKPAEIVSEVSSAETPVSAEAVSEPQIGTAAGEARVQPVTGADREAPAGRGGHRQKRGRRGGRESRTSRREQPREGSRGAAPEARTSAPVRAGAIPPRDIAEQPESTPEVAAAAVPSLRGRFGDPGLTSRLMQLEMNFRRLLGATPTPLEVADKAPAGPGVWVLTDSDLTTYYYVEPCQTLRVAIPNLLRGGSSRKGESIRPKLAEHLGIPEAKVGKYLSEHCVVRWLQMDEDAAHFAHFLVAVLRPALNE